ncbi:hypothetical protein [Halobellus clavatus]|jgi:hypothetical protein|uniref:Uncharacterized protein n=1 Tax=Halobellus clavatus TaxID=660517 RepID=A0A1H3HX90_9EURY|nr:hypothetical protein [Halobellus clavatus]SDY20076.1 hypothetical protein SAMN04487946_108115 [Halobellus clavatus]
MERTFRVETGDGSFPITAIRRADWRDLREPCPVCGGGDFDHVSTSGGHYGQRGTAVVLRADRWAAERSLLTRCRACGTVLDKHAAIDLLFEFDRDVDSEEA